MIHCEKCGELISPEATECPKCGQPRLRFQKGFKWSLVELLCAVVTALALPFIAYKYTAEQDRQQAESARADRISSLLTGLTDSSNKERKVATIDVAILLAKKKQLPPEVIPLLGKMAERDATLIKQICEAFAELTVENDVTANRLAYRALDRIKREAVGANYSDIVALQIQIAPNEETANTLLEDLKQIASVASPSEPNAQTTGTEKAPASALDSLKTVATLAETSPAIRQAAGEAVKIATSSPPGQSPTPAPKGTIYLHIADEKQRQRAALVEAAFKKAGYAVEGIQNVKGKAMIPGATEVRRFRHDDDAKLLAAEALKTIESLDSALVRITYVYPANKLEESPGRLEIWFSEQALTPAPVDTTGWCYLGKFANGSWTTRYIKMSGQSPPDALRNFATPLETTFNLNVRENSQGKGSIRDVVQTGQKVLIAEIEQTASGAVYGYIKVTE